jgi:hypothetical protein
MRLLANKRKAVNNKLYTLCKTYHESIPLDTINGILRDTANIELLDDDGTELSCLLCGTDSYSTFPVGKPGMVCSNSVLVMTWHQMQSGRWEIVAYLS